MAGHVDLSALDRLRARIVRLKDPDAGGLMVSLMQIIVNDNKKGVLAGKDRDDVDMAAVTYRPKGRVLRPTSAQRNLANSRLRRGRYSGFGMAAAGLHNNLTRREYERLGGPPLAPRGAFSRVITNLLTGHQRVAPGVWEAYGYWDQVVSTKGVPFLHAHFTGAATGRGHRVKLPRRDLRGVRPAGMVLARKAAVNWMRGLFREIG